ncbi:sigma 54-interacting transcriptional regulator [Leptospira sp. GIMC2001]|uniref:sigma 54-interacting transcriptional regulator n=1 Tax=Leptospira sp. GIMC2001 TaxID=1513297 RepID=UPI00234BAA8A|nr:sigma 54-interacting transcriptional regulator [Leptospira sp. GIMC2001]WCL49796.1 sigma 54-interacting transcriptional regulator [Leptospira sp. GIMC2001]
MDVISEEKDFSELISHIQVELRNKPTISAKMDYILEESLRLFDATTGSISLADPEQKLLTIVAAKGMDGEKKLAAKFPFSVGITGQSAANKEVVYSPDVSNDPSYVKLIESVQSELAIPLIAQGQTIGVLNIESDKVDHFAPTTISRAKVFANQLTFVLLEERITKEAVNLNKSSSDPIESIIGFDAQMLFLKTRIRNVASTETSVLIIGEEGAGKQLVAKALHRLSSRREGPFEIVDCSALSGDLLEVEMFGAGEVGTEGRIIFGKLERAHKGTLFIDAIGDLPSELQKRLLQVLKQGTLQRGKGEKPIALDLRIISGTSRDLIGDLEKESFNLDLYYRLAEIPLRLPPLRERRGDIPLLAHYFLLEFNGVYGKNKTLAPDSIKVLSNYSWPGNVRQLRNLIQYSVIVNLEDEIQPASFQGEIMGKSEFPIIGIKEDSDIQIASPVTGMEILSPADNLSLKIATERLEAMWIREAFQRVHTQEEAAKLLGISRGALQYKIRNNRFLADFHSGNNG